LAARSPRQRFEAASALGQLYLDRGDTGPAIEWFLRAAEAPASSPESGYALLYSLAETLEHANDHARALAIFVELEAESGGYRDAASRVERLSKVQAKG
jgi:lipopolysaccharide biosynthesis regulator YciM